MLGGVGAQLVLVGVLVLVNALFSGSEMALVSLRESQLQRLEKRGRRGRILGKLARDPNRFLATIQIGITLAGFLASATAAVALAEPMVPLLRVLGPAARPASIVLFTLALTFVTLVIGELAPKRIAMQRVEGWSLLAARPLDVLSTLSRPAVWVLSRSTDALVRVAGADPDAHRDEITPDELREMVAGHQEFTPEQREIISGAIEITRRSLRSVLVPRLQVFTVDAAMPVAEARAAVAASGYSRAPVVRNGSLDEAAGVVSLRELVVQQAGTAGDHARPPLLLPESLQAADALRRFKAERQQLAFVVDERGAIAGIITLEDLLEELVGEIYDETDPADSGVQAAPDGSLALPGMFPVHDLHTLGVDLTSAPPGGYATVAGLVLSALGHIPTAPGEEVTAGGWTFQVTRVERRAITGVRLRRAAVSPTTVSQSASSS
ncbi:MAG: magnesium and cobalt exporter, family [Cryptosporangiaceae bacterium]|nr:magnesium and cobalt exporter, family [Cryptosporangiaceae bacterium]